MAFIALTSQKMERANVSLYSPISGQCKLEQPTELSYIHEMTGNFGVKMTGRCCEDLTAVIHFTIQQEKVRCSKRTCNVVCSLASVVLSKI